MGDTRAIILQQAILVFSRQGDEGVSMRNIAEAVDISTPSLYNHFKNKQALYIAAITDTFENKSELLQQALSGPEQSSTRLQRFITQLRQILHDDPDFRRLMKRELLDGDKQRLRYLAQEVFAQPFQLVMEVLLELKPGCDAHSLAVIVFGTMPKMMTALTVILSMIPATMGIGAGMVSSTLLTLVVVPAVYSLVENGLERFIERTHMMVTSP